MKEDGANVSAAGFKTLLTPLCVCHCLHFEADMLEIEATHHQITNFGEWDWVGDLGSLLGAGPPSNQQAPCTSTTCRRQEGLIPFQHPGRHRHMLWCFGRIDVGDNLLRCQGPAECAHR
jgi:hypothetical protein